MNKLEFVSPAVVNPETLTRSNGNSQANRSTPASGDGNRVQAVDPAQLGEAVERLNENSQLVQRELDFKVNEESGRITVTVRDAATDEARRRGDSVVVDEISDTMGVSRNQILVELDNRRKFLRRMVDDEVDDYREFTRRIRDYYANPHDEIEEVGGEKVEELLDEPEEG